MSVEKKEQIVSERMSERGRQRKSRVAKLENLGVRAAGHDEVCLELRCEVEKLGMLEVWDEKESSRWSDQTMLWRDIIHIFGCAVAL